jgi:hypothetical protein
MNKISQETIKDVIQARLELARVLGGIIRDIGPIPSGHLYARVMGHLDLFLYNQIIGDLKKAGLVIEKMHLLIWVGPETEESK